MWSLVWGYATMMAAMEAALALTTQELTDQPDRDDDNRTRDDQRCDEGEALHP